MLVCAFAQILVHMVYFLHMTPKAEDGWLLLSTVFTIILVVITLAGSLWIVFHLNRNMMPMPDGGDAGHAGRRADACGRSARPHGLRRLSASVASAPRAIAGFVALGVWQLQRRAWKLDLIERVDARLAAAPVAAPGPADWPALPRPRRIHPRAAHRPLPPRARGAVQAVTERGPGYWVVTPLETPDFTVLVNRGFVPQDRRDPATRPEASSRARSPSPGCCASPSPAAASCAPTTPPPAAGIRATSPPSPRPEG